MKTTTISDRDAFELAQGRVPARPELDSLADLLTAYRSAAIGPAPRPSAALSARVDLSATPIALQRDIVADFETKGVATRRAASGLLGLGVTVAIILGAASGAAAVVSMGSAGLLPPEAQGVFDQVVSDIAPPGVVGENKETTDRGEAPGVPIDSTTTPEPTADVPGTTAVDPTKKEDKGSVDDGGKNDGPSDAVDENHDAEPGNEIKNEEKKDDMIEDKTSGNGKSDKKDN